MADAMLTARQGKTKSSMITPTCDYCKIELREFGAILLSPPNGLVVKKFHICKDCYEKIKPNETADTRAYR